MGASSSRKQKQPQEIAEFRKLGGPVDHYVIPEVPEKRKVTDLKFTITFAVALTVLAAFLIYTLCHADFNRIIHGYDDCGNVCGSLNSKVSGIGCSGADERDKPYLRLDTSATHRVGDEEYTPGECVTQCDTNSVLIFNRCYPIQRSSSSNFRSSFDSEFETKFQSSNEENFDFEKVLKDIASDLQKSAGRIVALCFIGLGFCIVMLLLFRYFVAVTVWVILIGSVLGVIAITALFWWMDSESKKNPDMAKNRPLRVFAIFFTIVSLVIIIMLIVLFKRIKLIIRLFKEAMKIIFNMPLILLEPLLTFLACLIWGIVFITITMAIATAGNLELIYGTMYDYSPNGAMIFTLWFHVVMSIWMVQFIIGCQHMVISGAVSAHYFTKDKSTLQSPIYYSFYNLIRYHLGTVAFGSLIITIIAVIKALIRGLVNNKHAKILVDCCLGAVEDFLKYLSKNAYIETAMHGQPFYKSGKRAVRLLYANAISAIAVNSVGDFILFMAKLLIVAFTVVAGILMADPKIPYFGVGVFIAVVITAILADCFFAVFETAIDTLFLCFCEDSCMNDGMARPYYMSVDMMQYMEEAKAQTKEKK